MARKACWCFPLAFSSMVAPRTAPSRSLGALAPSSRVRAHSAQRPSRAIRALSYPYGGPGLRRVEWLESWHADFAEAQSGDLSDDFPGKQMAIQLFIAGRRPLTWRSYSSKLQRWFDFCTRVRGSRANPFSRPSRTPCALDRAKRCNLTAAPNPCLRTVIYVRTHGPACYSTFSPLQLRPWPPSEVQTFLPGCAGFGARKDF